MAGNRVGSRPFVTGEDVPGSGMVPVVHGAQMDSYRDGAITSLREIVRGALPQGTRVLAGEELLGARVTWAVALRPRPASLGDLQGGELILLSTEALAALDPSPTLARVIESLAGNASGLAVRGTVPAEAIATAESFRLPLLELPPGTSITAIEHEIQTFLAGQRTAWYQRQHSVLHELTALALQQRGLEALARRMGELSGSAVAFSDRRGGLLQLVRPLNFPLSREALEDAVAGIGTLDSTARHGLLERDEAVVWQRAPVVVRDDVAGWVTLLGEPEANEATAQLVLEAGATAAGIEFAREHAVRETVHRIRGDLISDLVLGTGNPEEIAHQAERMGYDLGAPRTAIVIQLTGSAASGGTAAAHRRLRHAPIPPVGPVPYNRVPAYTEAERLTLFPEVEVGMTRQTVVRVASEMLRAVQVPGVTAIAGISRIRAGTDSFRLTYQEAGLALSLGQALILDRRVVHFSDLGVYRLLLSAPSSEMEEFHQETLGTLAAHDREKGSRLLPTLDAFLRAENATEAAARLNLHRNSLLYRLRRIREITGLDLDDPEVRFTLQLALRVGDALRAQEQ